MIDLGDIEAARSRIEPYVRRTPAMRLSALRDPLPVAAEVSLKLELFQVTGSFKARGAMNRLLAAPAAERGRGIVTASGGNHGLAVSRTAYVAGMAATVFVPSGVSPAKVAKMRQWNADVRIVGEEWSQSNEAALAFAKETGAAYFHPFADPLVVAGQGTLGVEILDDLPDIDTLVIAIGGGGLIAGLGTAVAALKPSVRIVGVEPTGSPTLKACLDAGRLVALDAVTSRVPTMSCRMTVEPIYEAVRSVVSEIILVSDDDMQDASRWLFAETGIPADLSGAASLAALRARPEAFAGSERICALVCGSGLEGTV